MLTFDRGVYFDTVRGPLFGGSMSQPQVDGQNFILDCWEYLPIVYPDVNLDLRWLAYMLATTKHETASTMQPVAEYGYGEGMEYGVPDPETGQTYYGRGFVQLTWRDNYARASVELDTVGTTDDLEIYADRALDPVIAARVMFAGMHLGWFRAGENLDKYFNEIANDSYSAREIINGDKSKVPSWSGGVSIGNLIAGYHENFLFALNRALVDEPEPGPDADKVVQVRVDVGPVPAGVAVQVFVNGKEVVS